MSAADDRELDALVERLILVLQSQRRLGGAAYPPTLKRLAELLEARPTDDRFKKAIGKKAFKDRAIVAGTEKGKPLPNAPVVLADAVADEDEMASVAPALLNFAFDRARTNSVKAFSVSELKKKVTTKLQKPFAEAMERAMEWQSLPPEYAWIKIRTDKLLRLDDLQGVQPRPATGTAPQPSAAAAASEPTTTIVWDEPATDSETTPVAGPNPAGETRAVATGVATAPAADFERAFVEAFERLDRRNGATNFVKLADLRRELPGFGREGFDAGLNALRDRGLFSLDSHEGLYTSLTPEEREAGLREAGSLLVYASRR